MATPIPQNRAEFSLSEIAQATGGRLVASGSPSAFGVTTDSRGDVAGKLFVPLVGDQFDGHDFARTAVERGAAGVLASRDLRLPEGAFVVRVPCTLAALAQLAHHHRRRWGGVVVAVGGSAGKTTTRSAVTALLGQSLGASLHFARGNLNNQVGVPLVLLGAEAQHRVLVVEVGTNAPGEVARLAAIAEPDLAVLTLVALEHSEGLGGLDAIEREEGDLLAAVGQSGTVVVNGDDARARRQLQRCVAATHLKYGRAEDCEYRLVDRSLVGVARARLALERGPAAARERLEFETTLVGLPGALAAVAGLAVADRILEAPVSAAAAGTALAGGEVSEAGRLVPTELEDGTVVIDDSYNANPASVRSSLRVAAELAGARGARLLVVLGEMRELGDCSLAEHMALGADVCETGAALLIGVSGHAAEVVRAARGAGVEAEFVGDAPGALALVQERRRPGDVILVKASRGVRAEQVVSGLYQSVGART